MPTQDQNRSRQKKNHQKQIHAGIIAQPAAQQRPRQVQPARAAYAGRPGAARSSHAPGRPISPCAVVVQTTGSARTLPGASRLVPRTLGVVLPVLCAAKRRVRRGAHKPACKCRNPLPFYQRYAAQKKSEAPYTRRRPSPRCRQMRGIAVHAATFDRPSQPHPSTPTEQRKSDCSSVQRRAPPTSRARIAGGANPAFAVPHRPGRQAHVCAPHRRRTWTRAKAGRTCQGLLHYRTGGKRPPPAASGSYAFRRSAPSGRRCQASAPHQLPSQPGRKAYESCNEGPLPEPTPPAADRSQVGGAGQGGGGVMRRGPGDGCIGGRERREGARNRSDNRMMRGGRMARRGTRFYSAQNLHFTNRNHVRHRHRAVFASFRPRRRPHLRSRKPPESRSVLCRLSIFTPGRARYGRFSQALAHQLARRGQRSAAARFVQVVDFSRPGSFDDPLPPQRCD